MKIGIISDSDSFVPTARALVSQRIQVALFYSPSPDSYTNQVVEIFIKQLRLPTTREKNPQTDIYHWLRHEQPDVCFIIGYNQLIALDKLNGLSTQLFNIHFGSLPAFRGPSPIFWQLKRGIENIGLCIHGLNEKYDDGPVYWKKEIPNLPNYNLKYVSLIFSELCVEGVFLILQRLLTKIPLIKMTHSSSNNGYQHRPSFQDVSVDWSRMTSDEICNLIKACNPWNKGAITFWKRQEIKLMDGKVTDSCNGSAGKVTDLSEKIKIATVDGKAIEVSMIYYLDSYWSAYHLPQLGFNIGDQLGNL